MRFLFVSLFVSAVFWSRGIAQERMTVTDPEIEFSFDLPDGWETKNDDYYFYILDPDSKSSQLSITYFNENTPRELDEIVETRLKYTYPEMKGFKHLETDLAEIDGVQSYVVKFKSKLRKKTLINHEYIFLKEGQVFYLLLTVDQEEEGHLRRFSGILTSFSCRYL